jgi:hypothetical protein
LYDDERERLTSSAGCIITEDSNGFVTVTYYDTKEELEKKWAAISSEFESDNDGEEDENN